VVAPAHPPISAAEGVRRPDSPESGPEPAVAAESSPTPAKEAPAASTAGPLAEAQLHEAPASPGGAAEPPSGRLDRLPSPHAPGPRRGGPAGRRGLLIGAGVALALGAAAALLFRPGLEEGGEREAPATAAAQDAVREGSAMQPTREAYRPPDREAVRRAYARAAEVYRAEGASGLARFGQACFQSLESDATYDELDFCLAFDAYGAAITQRLSGGRPASPDSYFGRTEARHLQVAGAVMGGEGDASARLIDIRRLAIEVAREAGPAVTRARAPAPAPSEAAEPDPRAAPPAPEPALERRAPAPPPPLRLDPVEARAPGRPDPAPDLPSPDLPSAQEVAASRPAGRGPSFNCRGARSTSERMVCSDPELAALDRRLNAAYEDAIAAGASRRELRAEQDRWLSTREAAAPDPDAVAQVYRRRIRELNAMR